MPEYRQPGGAGSSDGPTPSLPLSAGIGANLQRAGGPRFRSSQDTRPASATPPGAPGATNAASPARTTLPTKQHIRCYECSYEFDLTGRMGTTHCPKCRAALDLAGYTIDAECRETLKTLIAAMGVPVRAVLREKGTPYAELGLDDSKWSDEHLIDFMLQHPILINRPIVATPLGTRLCRPSETVLDILPQPQRGAFSKEDGEAVVDAEGRRV